MAQSDQQQVESRVVALLNSNEWNDVVVDSIKQLASPFHSDDATLLGCYAAATRDGSASIIYSDPIPDS
jgi:hypothetical protein